MKKGLKILQWVLSGFMALVALVYFPSFTSVLAIVFAVICAPIGKLQEFFASKKLKGIAKGGVLSALFLAAIMATPDSEPEEIVGNDPPAIVDEQNELEQAEAEDLIESDPEEEVPTAPPIEETAVPEEKPEPISQPESTQTPKPESQPQPEPEPTPTPEPEQQPTEEETTIRGRSSSTIVHVSSASNTIHSVSDCSGMKNYRDMTLGDANQKGYDYCPNCW